MLPIKLLGETGEFTPDYFLRVVDRRDEYLIVDGDVAVPHGEVIGLSMEVLFKYHQDGKKKKVWTDHLYRVYVDGRYYAATNPVVDEFEIDDLKMVNNLDPRVEYAMVMKSNMEHDTGIKSWNGAPVPNWTIESVLERERHRADWKFKG